MAIGGLDTAYTDYITNTAKDGSAAVKDKLSSDFSDASDEELMGACKEFEAYFLEQIFDTMMESTKIFSDEKEDSYATKMVDYFKDSAVQAMTQQATEQNGMGLAKVLYEQMKRQYSAIDPDTL